MGYSAYISLGTAALADIGTEFGEVPVHDWADNITVGTLTSTVGVESTEYTEDGIKPYGARTTPFRIGGINQTGSMIDISLVGMRSGETGLKAGTVNVFGGNATTGTADGGDLNLSGGAGFGGGALGKVFVEGDKFELFNCPIETNSTIDGVDLATFAASPVTLTKTITIDTPANNENITMFFTPIAITCTKCNSVTIGASSDATFNLYWNAEATRGSTGTAIHSASMVAGTAGTDTTMTNGDIDVPANSWVFIKTSDITNAPTELHVTLTYTED